jgi:hypothetical protein
MEEELEVEERMSAGMGVDVSSGWYFAFFSACFALEKEKDLDEESRRRV